MLDPLWPGLQVNVQQVWLSFSSGVLAFVFIFGNNIRNIYESCLLLFVVRLLPLPCVPSGAHLQPLAAAKPTAAHLPSAGAPL